MWLKKCRIAGVALACFVATIHSGCASNKSIAASWIGDHIDDVTAAWGAPDARIARESGGYTYTYNQHAGDLGGREWVCKWTFVTNKDNRVTQVNHPSDFRC